MERGSTLVEVILAITILSLVVVGVGNIYLVTTRIDALAQKKMQAGEYLAGMIERAVADAKAGILPQASRKEKALDLPWLTIEASISPIAAHAYSYEVAGTFQEGGVQWKLTLARILYLPQKD